MTYSYVDTRGAGSIIKMTLAAVCYTVFSTNRGTTSWALVIALTQFYRS